MLRQRQVLLLIGVVTLGIAVAELITSDPLTRLIPADVLRGKFFREINFTKNFVKLILRYKREL